MGDVVRAGADGRHPPDHHAPGSCACEPCRIYVLTRAGKKAEALDKAKALIADQEAAFAYAMNCAAHGGSGHCRYTTCPCWTVEYCDSETPPPGPPDPGGENQQPENGQRRRLSPSSSQRNRAG